MELKDPASPIPVPTLTHARLRAEQGDVEGARWVARQILRDQPGDRDALRLLDSLSRRAQQRPKAEPAEDIWAAPEPRRAEDLARAFRRELSRGPADSRSASARLEDWLARIREMRSRGPS